MAERERMMQQTPVLARLICEDYPMDGRQADREGRDATNRDGAPPPSETPPAQAAQESPKVESNPNEAGKFSNLHKKRSISSFSLPKRYSIFFAGRVLGSLKKNHFRKVRFILRDFLII